MAVPGFPARTVPSGRAVATVSSELVKLTVWSVASAGNTSAARCPVLPLVRARASLSSWIRSAWV